MLGHDLRTESRQIKDQVGYMTQKFSLYEDLSIEENLDLVAGLYRLPEPRAKVAATLDGLGLTSRRKQLAGSLSGGWKQRLALAACIMHAPQLLLLDEPTAGVDPKARREFWDEIHALAAGRHDRARLHPLHGRGRALPPHQLHRLRAHARRGNGRRGAGAFRAVDVRRHRPRARRRRPAAARPTGVEQIAAFGDTLHVVGRDPDLLRAALADVGPGVAVRPDATTLEDVFIRFMSTAEDNMQ